MKKSFMTRALAMGLSFAMAFSMAAATNVTTASAAAKKAGVTTMMKVSSKSVTEGKSVKTYMNSTALKKYRIKKVGKLSATADKYIDVEKISSAKGVKITAHDGAVTAAKLTKKGVYVTIYFAKTTSPSKAAKATAAKYVKLKVAVQAKPVEKTTMTAAATKVKQITVTFNKAVDDTTTKITVKKNTAIPTVSEVKFDDTKKVATLAMAGKLTKGTYTVTAVVGDDTLTYDVVVEKDETLSGFKLVSKTLKAKTATNTTTGTIQFYAVNQYEEKMSGANATVTVAPGTVKAGYAQPTKDKASEVTIEDIPTTYAIAGMEFTVLIVDSTGVTLQDKVVYGATAKAAKATSVGLYNTSKAKFMDMTAGDKISDYVALFTLEDQYTDPYEAKDSDAVTSGISAVALGNLTNVKAESMATGKAPIKEVGGKKYLCVKLTNLNNGDNKAAAGDFTLNLVNGQYGTLGEFTYTVLPNTEVKTLSISSDMIYAGQKNEMTFAATDVNGNEITKYDVLKGVKFDASGNGKMAFEKNADGTAKLVYDASSVSVPKGAKTTVESFTATANKVVSSNYFVQTYTFTISAKRYPTAVVGVNSKFATSTATTGKALGLEFKKLLVEDQYGNLFTEDELKAGTLVQASKIVVSRSPLVSGVSTGAWGVSGASINATGAAFSSTTSKIEFMSPNTSGAITNEFKFYVIDDKSKLNTDPYTLKMSKVASSDKKKISNITIDSIADGKMVYAPKNATFTANITDTAAKASTDSAVNVKIPVVVTATAGEHKIILGSDQVDAYVTCAPIKPWSNINDNQTETATMTVKVTTEDGTVTVTKEFQVSNTPGVAAKLATKDYDGNTNKITASGAGYTASSLNGKAFEVTDQYGNKLTPGKDALYTIAVTKVTTGSGVNMKDITKDAEAGVDYELTNADGMNSAKIVVKKSAIEVTTKITVTIGDKTVSFDQVFKY